MSVSITPPKPLEIVRGDDVVLPVTIKTGDINSTEYLDYSAYTWKSTFRYSANSPIFFPAIVSIDDDLHRLLITFTDEQTKIMAGPGVIDLESVTNDADELKRTWFKAPVVFVEDVTYVE